MFKPLALAAISLAPALISPMAWAQRSSVIVVTPPYSYQPGAGPQIGGQPHQGPGFTIYPPLSSTQAPQLSNPAFNPYPPGAQTCVATPYTCPASAPNTPGNPCACPTNEGGSVEGTVH